MKKISILFLLVFGLFSFGKAQNIEGTWKTIDDETGQPKSYVTIYESNGEYFGKISKILNKDKQDAVCDKCTDSNKDKPIMGMIIIRNLEKISNEKYANGKILDPNKGKEYNLKIFPKSNEELVIEGSIKMMGMSVGRKQSWYRVK